MVEFLGGTITRSITGEGQIFVVTTHPYFVGNKPSKGKGEGEGQGQDEGEDHGQAEEPDEGEGEGEDGRPRPPIEGRAVVMIGQVSPRMPELTRAHELASSPREQHHVRLRKG